MCVRKISAQCVLQFTPSLAAGCVLHRPVSRVIHCSELYFQVFFEIRRPLFLRSSYRQEYSPGGEVRGSTVHGNRRAWIPHRVPGVLEDSAADGTGSNAPWAGNSSREPSSSLAPASCGTRAPPFAAADAAGIKQAPSTGTRDAHFEIAFEFRVLPALGDLCGGPPCKGTSGFLG